MTEESQQTESSSSSTRSSPLVQAETQPSTPDVPPKTRDIKKEKCRAMTKVVIRRLPPSMNQAQFMEQISPLPEHDYLYFVKADMSLGQYAFSRAYINFTDQRDIFIFREKFDNYVFVDAKGTEYPAVVEFAPFQRLPKKRVGKKKDVKCGSIETDPYYVSFLESLQNLEGDSAVAQPKTEYSYQPADNTQKKVTTTPLLEYLKQRKQEKQRLKDEKREERRRRDLERRRAKDELTISKPKYRSAKSLRREDSPISVYDSPSLNSKPIERPFADNPRRSSQEYSSQKSRTKPDTRTKIFDDRFETVASKSEVEKNAAVNLARFKTNACAPGGRYYRKAKKYVVEPRSFFDHRDNPGRRVSEVEFTRRRGNAGVNGGYERCRLRLKTLSKTRSANLRHVWENRASESFDHSISLPKSKSCSAVPDQDKNTEGKRTIRCNASHGFRDNA